MNNAQTFQIREQRHVRFCVKDFFFLLNLDTCQESTLSKTVRNSVRCVCWSAGCGAEGTAPCILGVGVTLGELSTVLIAS